MKYFFVLGNNPTLSIAEIMAIFPSASGKLANFSIFILDLDAKIDPPKLIKQLGGTIKIGIINQTLGNTEEIFKSAIDLINKSQKIKPGEKFNFGFSVYGNVKINTKALGMEIKKEIKNFGVNARMVVSREKTLSSVVVEQNKLTSRGLEIVLAPLGPKEILIGQTLAVQPFKELSYRDYGRPGRDDYSGMLPPKLAQIMINLAQPKPTDLILDPFCGSGTILTEALLMGQQNLIGSDISTKALADTETNINWVQEKFSKNLKKNIKVNLYQLSATELTKKIKAQSVDLIITEPYLGPQRGPRDFKIIAKELEALYSKVLKEFFQILKPQGKVVMIWPCFTTKNSITQINPEYPNFKITTPLPLELINKGLKVTKRQTIIYGRDEQTVWREIVILTKK